MFFFNSKFIEYFCNVDHKFWIRPGAIFYNAAQCFIRCLRFSSSYRIGWGDYFYPIGAHGYLSDQQVNWFLPNRSSRLPEWSTSELVYIREMPLVFHSVAELSLYLRVLNGVGQWPRYGSSKHRSRAPNPTEYRFLIVVTTYNSL